MGTIHGLIAVSAAFSIYCKLKSRAAYVLVKPLTMLLILMLAITGKGAGRPDWNWIFFGLVFGLVGDLFLLSKKGFLPGLAAFLMAHLLYTAGFAQTASGTVLWLAVPPAVAGLAVFAFLAPGLGRFRIPVLIYVAAIGFMVWQAWSRWYSAGIPGSLTAALGAMLFFASDGVLAWNRFRSPVPAAHGWILGTYFPAQWLLALSVTAG